MMIWERDIEAAARVLDPIAFWPRRKHGSQVNGVSEDYWEHIRSRRASARQSARRVIETMQKRGWRVRGWT